MIDDQIINELRLWCQKYDIKLILCVYNGVSNWNWALAQKSFDENQDVFINVVGGVKLSETGADLAVLAAVLSSLRDKPIPRDLIIFGEVGLTGEIRPVQAGEERISDAAKHGFKYAIVPTANAPRKTIKGIKVVAVQHLSEAIDALK